MKTKHQQASDNNREVVTKAVKRLWSCFVTVLLFTLSAAQMCLRNDCE